MGGTISWARVDFAMIRENRIDEVGGVMTSFLRWRDAMAVSLFTDRRMIDHHVPARHPERPERLQAILRHLERTGYLASLSSRAGPRSHDRRAGPGSSGRILERGDRGA